PARTPRAGTLLVCEKVRSFSTRVARTRTIRIRRLCGAPTAVTSIISACTARRRAACIWFRSRTPRSNVPRPYVCFHRATTSTTGFDSPQTTRSRRSTARYSLLQDLPRSLVRQDLPLDPLERVVDRLGVAAELAGHLP